jgi:hypothetical protein
VVWIVWLQMFNTLKLEIPAAVSLAVAASENATACVKCRFVFNPPCVCPEPVLVSHPFS